MKDRKMFNIDPNRMSLASVRGTPELTQDQKDANQHRLLIHILTRLEKIESRLRLLDVVSGLHDPADEECEPVEDYTVPFDDQIEAMYQETLRKSVR